MGARAPTTPTSVSSAAFDWPQSSTGAGSSTTKFHERTAPPEDLARLNDQIKFSHDQWKSVQALWAAIPSITAVEKPDDTKVIKWVAHFLFPDDQKEISIRRQWAELSGVAHALGWQLVGRRTTPMTRERSGLRRTAAEASIEYVADPYLGAFAILQRGWALFDRRCTGP